jgi:hypothetical protein
VSVAVAMSSAGFIVNVMIEVIRDRALAAVFEVGFLIIYRISASAEFLAA